jgi:hypothetical protein
MEGMHGRGVIRQYLRKRLNGLGYWRSTRLVEGKTEGREKSRYIFGARSSIPVFLFSCV